MAGRSASTGSGVSSRVVRATQPEESPHLGERLASRRDDRRQGLSSDRGPLFHRPGGRLGLDHDDGQAVGHDVVEFTGDPAALCGGGELGLPISLQFEVAGALRNLLEIQPTGPLAVPEQPCRHHHDRREPAQAAPGAETHRQRSKQSGEEDYAGPDDESRIRGPPSRFASTDRVHGDRRREIQWCRADGRVGEKAQHGLGRLTFDRPGFGESTRLEVEPWPTSSPMSFPSPMGFDLIDASSAEAPVIWCSRRPRTTRCSRWAGTAYRMRAHIPSAKEVLRDRLRR